LKKFSAIIALMVILFAVSASNAQNQVTVHVTGGYDLPMGDFKGTFPTDTNSYFMKSGFNGGADVAYNLGKKRNVGITLSVGYHAFNSGDITSNGIVLGKIKTNIIVAGLGIQYAFMPKGKANPFIGVEFTGNFYSGKFTPATGTESTLNSASRFGVQGNLGVDIKASKNIGFVVGLRYNLANLIGKDSASTSAANTYSLMDKGFTVGTTTTSNKNISYLSLYGGVSFYFGQPKRMIRK